MNKKYFIIDYPLGNHGFFSQFNFLLGQLDYAYHNNLIPIVNWENSHLTKNNKNLFNEFFDINFDSNEFINDNNSILCPREFLFLVKGEIYAWPVGYPPRSSKIFKNKEVVTHLNFLFNYYFKIKDSLLKYLNGDILKYKTLGVHCRRSDMSLAHPENSLVTDNLDFFEKTMIIFHKEGFEKIYLATEEEELLNYFLERVGDKLLYQKCTRIKHKDDSVFWEEKTDDGILIAKEVLIDSISLSKCHSLLTGISGVTYGSIFFNGLEYDDVYYFDEV
jgi:hypothetical protein